jgi:MFS family permease
MNAQASTATNSSAAATTTGAASSSIWRSLRHRNFQLFFSGQLISLTGTWMQSVAQSWLVYRLTGSAALLGLVSFSGQIPVFLLAPVGGAVADRRNRHRILIATQTAAMVLAFGLAALTLAHRVHVYHVFLMAALLGLVNAFDIPARQAFVVEMVGKEDLTNAIALNSSMVNGARIVGPAIAGILVATIGEGWCFLLNGISYIAVIAGLLMMQITIAPRVARTSSAVADIGEGFRFVAGSPPVRALMLLLGLVSLTGMPYAVLMPVFADQILHRGSSGLGILMGASGFGAFLGAFSLAVRRGWRGLGTWVAYSSAGFGIALIAFALSRWFFVSMFLLVPVGFTMMVEMASSNTLLQVMVPDELRGRVMAVYSMMFMGMAPIGALLAGSFAGRWGAPRTVALGGVVCVLGALIFRWRLPRLRSQARQLILALESAAGHPPEEVTGDRVTSVAPVDGSLARSR